MDIRCVFCLDCSCVDIRMEKFKKMLTLISGKSNCSGKISKESWRLYRKEMIEINNGLEDIRKESK